VFSRNGKRGSFGFVRGAGGDGRGGRGVGVRGARNPAIEIGQTGIEGALGIHGLVALGAREVEDDFLGLVVQFLFFLLDDAVGMQELVGDVGENGGAAGRDAAFGGMDEEAGKKFAQVFRGGEMLVAGEEVLREVVRVTGGRREGVQGRMAEAKAVVAVQGAKTALAPVKGVVTAARGIGGTGLGGLLGRAGFDGL
jgi:hypothetical protein